jgi:2-oxoisovalerate dehydrogenase E1 component alpha subunit
MGTELLPEDNGAGRLDPDGTVALGAPSLVQMYRLVSLTREVDRRLWILARQGQAGFVLTARGHEVAQVSSAAGLRVGVDSAWPYYRDLGVALTLGVTPYEIFLGALAKATDPHSGSRQLTAHFSSPKLRIGSVSSEVGAHLPHAVGAAYAARVLGEDSVAVCWFGDGASSEGATHEAMTLAAVNRLPVVFICENNGWAISVPEAKQMAAPVSSRAVGYGMPGKSIDGTDADAVYEATVTALDLARAGSGPSLLELAVPRLVPHSSQDDDKYRTDEDRAAANARDPIPRLRSRLHDAGVSDATVDEEDRSVVDLVEADLQRALSEPDPEPARARRWLYAEGDQERFA